MQGFPANRAALAPWAQQGADWPRAATSPSLGGLGGGSPGPYPQAYFPNGGPPSIAPMPGPAALGPGRSQGSMGTGGVAGVGINPVSVVTPPAATGGPHPLPSLPSLPLPDGFPNPFDLPNQSGWAGAWASSGLPPMSPGTTTVIGPKGYLPGLGQFGTQGQGGQPGMPQSLPPGMPQGVPQAAAQATQPQPGQATQPGAQNRHQSSPFWMALAWQLVNTPAARSALGDRLKRLMEGNDRMRTIQVATALLLSPDMQNAFRALSTGAMQQTPFTALFAQRLGGALDAAGLGRAG